MKSKTAPILLVLMLYFSVAVNVSATISQVTQWDIQPGVGSSTNGGGFVAGATGTDMSQYANKNAAGCTSCQSATVNISTTDLVTAGTTTLVSATANFSSAIVGNIVYITGGTGSITATRYEVTAFTNSTTVTVDRSTGLTAGTGATLNIGGTLASYVTAALLVQNGHILWIKTGTDTVTATVVLPSGSTVLVQGYTTSHGDATTGTNRPLLTSATNSVRLFETHSNTGWTFRNLRMSHTAATRGDCVHSVSGGEFKFDNVRLTGCQIAINGNYSVDFDFTGLTVVNSEIENSISHGIINCAATGVFASYIHDNGGDGVNLCSHSPDIVNTFSNNVIYANAVNGIYDITTGNGHNNIFLNNDFVSNTGDGLKQTLGNFGQAFQGTLSGNIFYNNGGYGTDITTSTGNQTITDGRFSNDYNAYGTNTTAARNNLTAGTHDVALGACDPFVAKTANNFALSACGLTALKGVGFPGAVPSAGSGVSDIGALDSGTGGAMAGGNSAYVK